MTLEITGTAALVFLLARVLFGGVMAFTGLNHFLNAEDMSGYAATKGVPAAGLMVPFTGGILLFGGLSVALGWYPLVGAGAIALFLLVTTPVMHDFWAVDDPQQKQNELINFQKNLGLLGTALAFLVAAGAEWQFAIATGELTTALTVLWL